MEEGRRLENLSWRIWNRETFCCESQPQLTVTPAINIQGPRPGSKDIPELSTSVDSIASEEDERLDSHQRPRALPLDIKRPAARKDSTEAHTPSRGSQKHITSAGLEKMVISIKAKKDIEPLSPSIAEAMPMFFPSTEAAHPTISDRKTQQSPAGSSSSNTSSNTGPMSSPDSAREVVQTSGSDTSAELHISHSVVRGFSPSHISSSFRSHSHLGAESVADVKPIVQSKAEEPKKKASMFLLGGSSGEEDSSFEDKMPKTHPQSSLTAVLKKPTHDKKQTSFKDEVESRIISHRQSEDEDVFESDEDDEDVSESAIEEEDDSDWEDSSSESGQSSPNDKQLFQRVDSRPNLTSRRSLLTTLMHQPDRAAAVAAMASKSTPARHRSRTSSPTGPSVATSPENDSILTTHASGTKSKPITTSNIHPPCLSPRTTRRNMLATELTESLRKHLLWERQQKNTTANAVLKRRHTAHDMANLQQYPNTSGSGTASKNNSWNHYFDHGLGEYHQKGW
ncbi:MAG: hypothetical protein Q9187_005083 [Circinaria calcarea]